MESTSPIAEGRAPQMASVDDIVWADAGVADNSSLAQYGMLTF